MSVFALDITILHEFPVRTGAAAIMPTEALQTPVAFVVFNRPHTTRQVFEAISRARPAKLLLIADGPRQDREGDEEACRLVREIVNRVDWPCEVSRNFSESNLGCGERMISGLNWVFSQVEDAIILEDDCLPDSSFFPYCQELLERYRGDRRIAYISGSNLIEENTRIDDSYYFSRIGGIWGWATWGSEWRCYDRNLSDWKELKKRRMLEEIFDEPKAVKLWTRIFDAMHEETKRDIWDYHWFYTCLKNSSLIIVPRVNLVANVGFGEGATHTTRADPRCTIPARSVKFPLRHPPSYISMGSLDRLRVKEMLPPPIFRRILHKIRKIRGRLS
jgi:hypothetical protein